MTTPLPDAIVAELHGSTVDEILAQLCEPVARDTGVPLPELLATLREREALASTALGSGIAMPHGEHPGLSRVFAVLGRARTPVAMAAPDDTPVQLFVALLRPPAASAAHLKALAQWSRVLSDAGTRAALLAAPDAAAIAALLQP
ncbi:MAG: PTS sugar transporter subunit IIA [Nannocystaceae bacterium]|nr:PTS sugar transporter subunit IIA [Nannocystaceae bacterium]